MRTREEIEAAMHGLDDFQRRTRSKRGREDSYARADVLRWVLGADGTVMDTVLRVLNGEPV